MAKSVKQKVAVIMGSLTDWKVMKDACLILDEYKIPYKKMIVSAHRTPEFMQEFGLSARNNGYSLIIAGAGGAAHLPGMVASLTTLPVIGVPVCVGKLKGLDALLSVAQMPKGVPVATVAVDNAHNAGLLAARILGVTNSKISNQLMKRKKAQTKKIRAMKL